MSQGTKLVRFENDDSQKTAQASATQIELSHVRNVTWNVVQDTLSVWAEIWAELDSDTGSQMHDAASGDRATCGVAVTPEAEKGFKPSCGWPVFLEKMWVLRQNLDFLARFSRP